MNDYKEGKVCANCLYVGMRDGEPPCTECEHMKPHIGPSYWAPQERPSPVRTPFTVWLVLMVVSVAFVQSIWYNESRAPDFRDALDALDARILDLEICDE